MRQFILLLMIWAVVAIAPAAAIAKEEEAPPKTLEELDQRLQALINEGGPPETAPALYVLLIEGGETVFSKGYGVADRDVGLPPTEDTVFRIGSISKTFLGLAALMLVEEGKLDLDAPLSEIVPDVPLDNPFQAADPVRFIHLLEHTAGWPDLTLGEFALDEPHADLRAAAVNRKPFVSRYPPGQYFSYANGGYAVAGYALEAASGIPYDSFVRERIFQPLGLASASFHMEVRYTRTMAKGYLADGRVAPYDAIRDWPAGSINMSAKDLARFARLLERRGEIDGLRLVSAASIARMETAETTRAARLGLSGGYGLGNAPINGTKAKWRGHDGGIGTFISTMGYLPGTGKAFVALSSSEAINPLSFRLILDYLERDVPAVMPAEVPAKAGALEPFVGFYQRFPSRQPVLALIESLGYERVELKEGRLILHGEPRALTPEGHIRRADRPYASHALVTDAEGSRALIGSLEAMRHAPFYEVGLKLLYGVLAGAFVLGSLIFAFVWLIGWPLGRLKERGGPWPRAIAFLALAVPVALVAVMGVVGSGQSWNIIHTLGREGPIPMTIFGLTIAWPLMGLLALITGAFARGLGELQRIYVIGTGALLLVGALYAAQYGWIGLRTWAL